ncbi:MAG: sigma-70 family RNA polymerase sigma factor [Planctomycetes bacterium]|nr:sigma-70 family RNA polymerase sigma factor [Planctomycetota bacterium]
MSHHLFDADWHRLALAGRPEAIQMLADRTIVPLYRFCLYRLGMDEHACQDVVQETMLLALSRLDRYQPGRSNGRILPWLRGLARNQIRRVLSERKISSGQLSLSAGADLPAKDSPVSIPDIDGSPLDADSIGFCQTSGLVGATMSQLPVRYSGVLEDKYIKGRAVRDIAAGLGMTEKAVESLLVRARAAFKKVFTILSKRQPAAGNVPPVVAAKGAI